MNAAILVALEKYGDKRMNEVKFAEADARAFASVLERHGFDPANRELLVNGEATKTSIESAVRITFKRLMPDDTLYFHYTGHGFSTQGENYLACFDSRAADSEHTSISLKQLLQPLSESLCRRTVFFFDVCSAGLFESAPWRDQVEEWDHNALAAMISASRHGIGFASCKTGERSYSSSEWEHGIWNYHLIEAFDGRSRVALQGTRLTPASLQKRLESATPAVLRKTNPSGVQTPWMCGASAESCELANLEQAIASRKADRHPHAGQVKDSVLLSEKIESVKSLAGFAKNKGHFSPDRLGSRAQAFVCELAAADIQADLDKMRAALKREFRFTRLQLSAKNHGDGAATVTTPYFNYNVSVVQDPANPANVVWRRSVDAITDPDKVLGEAFARAFVNVFDTVELTLRGAIEVEQLIDFIESLANDAIEVDYDDNEHIEACIVRIQGHQAAIKITQHTFAVVHPRPASPERLLELLFDIQEALTDQYQVKLIPFAASR